MAREYVRAMVHLRFVCELYTEQVQAGRYFLHEHPANATSWQEECMQKVLELEKVAVTVGDQCQYGQQDVDGTPIKKPTKWMSNSEHLHYALGKRCTGHGGVCSRRRGGRHRHVEGARMGRIAQRYSEQLCKAILRGCRDQLRADGRLQPGVYGMQHVDSADVLLVTTAEECQAADDKQLRCLFGLSEGQEFRDAITGQLLRPELVREARRKELEYFVSKNVWDIVARGEAVKCQGKPPITVKWVDVNKGDDDHPEYRSRLVAREIRRHGEDSIFAPTPPLESLRCILSLATTDLPGRRRHVRDPVSEDRTQIQIIDISRAYFNAVTDDEHPTFVDLPEEHPDKCRGMCGRLRVHMYGTRRAAEGWHCEYAEYLEKLGFVRGHASACVFRHDEKAITTSVYGDDFTTEGPKRQLDWLKARLEERYELKELARLGPGPNDDREARILNRVVRWTADGVEYEADPRQAEKLLQEMKLEGCNSLSTPGVKITAVQHAADKLLDETRGTPFRAVAARANYLASDRPDCQYAAKEVCRWMSSPTEASLGALKRIGRYLGGQRRLVYVYKFQAVDKIDVYSDTDWAGCAKTRKSTAGGALVMGPHLLKSWSSTLPSVALSSGEAEFYGVVKAGGTGLGFQSLLRDLGHELPLRVWTDSTATVGICGRQGLGKLRHIDTQCLWIQQQVRSGAIELRKILGTENPADLFTKHLPGGERVSHLLKLFGCEFRGGRAESAPNLRRGEGTQAGGALEGIEEDTMLAVVGERVFDVVVTEYGDCTEAKAYGMEQLPHQLGSRIDDVFPKVEVVDETVEDEDGRPSQWEHHGTALGRQNSRDSRKQK